MAIVWPAGADSEASDAGADEFWSAAFVAPLSAVGDEQLCDQALRLRERLRALTDADLPDVVFTLQTGRTPLARRAAVGCGSMADLIAGLEALTDGRRSPLVRTNAQPPVSVPAGGATPHSAAASRWLAGEDLAWSGLWSQRRVRRVPLPTQRFSSTAPATTAVTDRALVRASPVARDRSVAGMQAYLLGAFADESGIGRAELDPHAPLDGYGLTSFLVTRLNARLENDLGETCRTLFYEHATLASVAVALSARRHDARRHHDSLAATVIPADWRPAEVDDRAAAIIGIAGRYPQADDLDQFWRNLRSGQDCVTRLPAARARPGWPAESMVGGFLDGVDLFDPLLFGITPREAALMDPQERIFLEVTWEALEDAGYPRSRLRSRHACRVGVFAGAMYNEYPYFGVEQTLRGVPTDSGSALGNIANRVSYHFGLTGPSLTVDTMCSSSVTAIHLAIRALRGNDCEVAIAGAVNLSLHPNKFIQQRRLGLTASDGRCRSFGEGGDGFVPSEGVGIVVLKPLRRALADGDRVHAVVLGTALAHAGKTNGYIVSSPVAQGEMVRHAWQDAGVDPRTVGYLEAHGAGTALGDPVEIDGLSRAFAGLGLLAGSVPIGSVKSAVGHTESAAGIAGVTKVVLQMRHAEFAPTLHAASRNPNIDWDAVPFRVQAEAAAWPALPGPGSVRRAGVSSFGAGGTIGHVVLESPPVVDLVPIRARPQLLVLSACGADRLAVLARRIADRLAATPDTELADVAYTLQVGRESLRERLCVVGESAADLAAALRSFAAGRADARLMLGRATPSAGATPSWSVTTEEPGSEQLTQIGRHWVAGGQVDWESVHPDVPRRPRIVPLPGYPFTRMRCWLPEPAGAGPAGRVPGRADAPDAPAAAAQGAERDVAAEVPLYERGWAVAAPEPGTRTRRGSVACLHTPATAELARGIAVAFVPRAVRLITCDETLSAAGILATDPDLAGWIDICDLDPATAPGDWRVRLSAMRDLLAARAAQGLRFLHVCQGLLGVPGPRPSLRGAVTAGFVRCLGAEYQRSAGTVLDTDLPTWSAELPRQIVGEWSAADAHGEVCQRSGQRYLPALVPLRPAEPRPLDPGAAYVVSGGTRGIGATVARYLASRGARRMALLGRSPLSGQAAAHIGDLERQGVSVRTHCGRLDDRAALGDFLQEVRRDLGPIAGVVHCAGRFSDHAGPFHLRSWADVDKVLEPKIAGTDVLQELCAPDGLDFFVLFSSIAAAVPRLAAGVLDYGAANAYLDYVHRHRTARGEAWSRCVNWPAWRDSGTGAGGPNPGAVVGIAALSDADALRILDQVLATPTAGPVLPVPRLGDWVEPDSLLRTSARQPLAVGEPVSVAPEPVSVAPEPTAEAPAIGPAHWLVALFSAATGIPAGDLDIHANFADLGVESVMLAEILQLIEGKLGRRLSPATLVEHPSLDQLAVHIGASERAAGAEPRDPSEPSAGTMNPAPPRAPVPTSSAAQRAAGGSGGSSPLASAAGGSGGSSPLASAAEPIAVIGMACRFPGAADTAEFWDNLVGGRCAVTEVPLSRWDHRRLYRGTWEPGTSISKWGGFVSGIEDFDPGYFGLSDDEGRQLDPSVRLFLEQIAACLSDAGYRAEELRGREIGVFAGGRITAYGRRAGLGASILQADQSFIAARAAHHFDLHGPSLVVDSACSSALVAAQLAVHALRAGDADLAVVGGVEILLDEQAYLEFTAGRALSPSGRCFTFDQRADGFVPGEGCGVLLLKPLAAALADGDSVHAVLEAVSVNNDGRTMGITTPNPAAQAALIRRALRAAGRSPREIGMVEAHGTGTLIGDPLELKALTDVYAESCAEAGWCAIGSVKSNIGHLLNAAGIAGLLKAVLAVREGVLPATLFCQNPNPRFDFASSPFQPNTRTRPWPAGARRVAGVSSFGLGGTNAHAVVGEYRVRGRDPLPPPEFHRRRLWLERDSEFPGDAAATFAGSSPELVSSLLELEFR